MTSRICTVAAALCLLCAPSSANAQRGGGHPGGAGGGRSAPAAQPAAMSRQAPAAMPMRQAPANFNFNHDIAPERRAAPIARPAMPVARPAMVARPAAVAARPPINAGTNATYHRAPVTAAASGGAYRGHFRGQPIANQRGNRGNWAWNHGSRWNPANGYWGGGFWGGFALASLGSYALYGSIDDSQDGYAYDSYRVDADTPGAELLNDYQLEQTQCGPPGLVDIWGPDGSVICAIPNDQVPPGNYQVDPQMFTLVPAT